MKKLVSITFGLMFLWWPLNNANASMLAPFFQTHGFVFFFASTCPYCHQFSSPLSKIVEGLNARVLPLSFDNQPLPKFPKFLPATSDWTAIAFKGRPIHYPALFIANPETLMLYPVSIGALDEKELVSRLEELVPKIMAFEKTGSVS